MVELELLAVVWAMRKCQIYLKGLPSFELIVDHKPLESILNTQTLHMVDNLRIQRIKEKLSVFIFHTTRRKGKDHVIPDALSRAPCRDPEPEDILNVDTTRMICKDVFAILRGKDTEVTKKKIYRSNARRLKRKYSAGRSSTTINYYYQKQLLKRKRISISSTFQKAERSTYFRRWINSP